MHAGQTSVIFRRSLVGLGLALAISLAGGGFWFYRYVHAYDDLIVQAGRQQGVDGRLIRAVIWQESHFNARRVGKAGEIGLMQVTPVAAKEWAVAQGIDNFAASNLFQPAVNIQAGAWYLGRAIQHWSGKSSSLPYALAEYNAGRANVERWAAGDGGDANAFWDKITYPGTRRYVRDVLNDYRGYR